MNSPTNQSHPNRESFDDAVTQVLQDMSGPLGDRIQRSAPLASFTTFGIGGPAAILAQVASVAELRELADAVDRAGLAIVTIGQGSNLLIADRGVGAVVVVLMGEFAGIEIDPGEQRVVAGAAVKLPVLARHTVAAGLAGFEWAVGVPGSVGGAIRMNAGGHGSDMAASVVNSTVLDTASSPPFLEVRPVAALDFSYRHSSILETDLVLDATLQLHPGDPGDGDEALREIVRWRREHQPGGANCGSVFTNPIGDSAGRLIDQAGLKGHRIGTVSVSLKHANFIQADPGAKQQDVSALVEHIQTTVEERFGVRLHAEVKTLGIDSLLYPADERNEPCQ
jgi:UDP-N-acetylmuramate dehydrogenase